MHRLALWIIFAVLSVITKPSFGIADLNKPPKHCIMERAHRMVGYNCAKLEMRDVPSYLKSSTEVSERKHRRLLSPKNDAKFVSSQAYT